MSSYDKERDHAAMDKAAASMELKLHGVRRDREARRRLEEVLGPILPARADNDEQSGRYDPLMWSLENLTTV